MVSLNKGKKTHRFLAASLNIAFTKICVPKSCYSIGHSIASIWCSTLCVCLPSETPCRACTRWPFLYCFFLGLLHTEMADRCRDRVVFHFTADINLHLFYLFIDLSLFYFAAFRYLMSIMNITSLQHSLPVSMATLLPSFLMSPIPSMTYP